MTEKVAVIGSGPAGLSAAWEARQAGAEVLVLEIAGSAGGGVHSECFKISREIMAKKSTRVVEKLNFST